MQKYYDFFLGATSPNGFADFFRHLCDSGCPLRTYIIKSGPGCGKSTMMRRIGARIIKAGHSIEFIHCSSDPDSLDGIICRELGFAIVDGTAPHILEPKLPAAKQEVVSLYDTLDKQPLIENFEKLRELSAANACAHERAGRFIGAAGALFNDAQRCAARCVLDDKLKKYALSLQKKLLTPAADSAGRAELRFSSAVTPKGIVSYAHDNSLNCKTVWLLEDRYGAAGYRLLQLLRDAALTAGYDVTESRCPMSPYDKLELLEIPALSLCFTLSSRFIPVHLEQAKRVNMQRFYDKAMLGEHKNRIRFSERACVGLLQQASALLTEAKAIHDKIEDIYKNCVDFSAVRKKEKQLIVDLGL